ncbi:uncharacterized protein N7484_002083 [Penicillium longicatenatum]|uniref:uncharacterized protein n=1 Tax=Penicillium longicatenatum TaxID=1561947 RepID=UPI0025483003|nr:uncharacterized protein N7484_002083 [Penicillium longicatenatum]KAJ5658434.1 hypothetical protein N7484_002083 [Penicillium longicatenatum]
MARSNLVDIHVGLMDQSITLGFWFALSHDPERGGGDKTQIRTADDAGKPMSPVPSIGEIV